VSERPLTISNVVMRYAPVVTKLRRMPVLGKLVHLAAKVAVPGEALVWSCVDLGPVQNTWIALNPRTGTTTVPQKDSVELHALLEQLKPGMTFYDLGANFGCYSLLAARLVGSGGAVFSFEPDP